MKRGVVKDKHRRKAWAYAQLDRCMVCGIPYIRSLYARFPHGLHVHHIIGGTGGRSDEPCNFLLVCDRCHRMLHGERVPDGRGGRFPRLNRSHALWCKREANPDESDPERLAVLAFRKSLAGPEELPQAIREERDFWLRPISGKG